jgi:hypothetical protein
MRTLSTYYQGTVFVWATDILKGISQQISDRSFLRDRPKREEILEKTLLITHVMQTYAHWCSIEFGKCTGDDARISSEDMEMILCPLNFPFKKGGLATVIDAVIPTLEEASSGTIPKFSTRESTLLTNTLHDLCCKVRDLGTIIKDAPIVQTHYKKLLKNPANLFTNADNVFSIYQTVAKGISISDSTSVFSLEDNKRSIWCEHSIFYNYSWALKKLHDIYVRYCTVTKNTERYADFHSEWFCTNFIVTAYFAVLKNICIEMETTTVETAPQMGDYVTVFITFTSYICLAAGCDARPGEKEFCSSKSDKETMKFMASKMEEVVVAGKQMFESILNLSWMTAELRMSAFWANFNILGMFSVAYLYHHGQESYADSTFLAAASLAAKSWSALIHDYNCDPELEYEYPERKEAWATHAFSTMETWPCLIARMMYYRQSKDSDAHKSTRARRTSEFDVDVKGILEAMKAFCEMSATVPLMIRAVKYQIKDRFQPLILQRTVLVMTQTLERVATEENAILGVALTSHIPEVIDNVLAAMKIALSVLKLPDRYVGLVHDFPTSTIDEVRLELMFSAFQPMSVLETAIAGPGSILQNHIRAPNSLEAIFSQFPASCEKKFTAAALVLIHILQKLPESLLTNERFIKLVGTPAARMRISDTLASIVLPSDVPQGLERLMAMSDRFSDFYMGYLQESRRGNMSQDMFQFHKNSRIEHNERIKDVLDAAKNASEADTERAIKRCEVLAELPCCYVGCLSFPAPGKENIEYKKCSGCFLVKYCSPKCQKKDWKAHKLACKALASSR